MSRSPPQSSSRKTLKISKTVAAKSAKIAKTAATVAKPPIIGRRRT